MANGYILPNLNNIARLRKLDKDERVKYSGDFWEVSNHLKLHDRVAKEQDELNDVNKHLAEATTCHLENQRQGHRTDLSEIDSIAEEAHEKNEALKEAREARDIIVEGTRQSGCVRKAPERFEGWGARELRSMEQSWSIFGEFLEKHFWKGILEHFCT